MFSHFTKQSNRFPQMVKQIYLNKRTYTRYNTDIIQIQRDILQYNYIQQYIPQDITVYSIKYTEVIQFLCIDTCKQTKKIASNNHNHLSSLEVHIYLPQAIVLLLAIFYIKQDRLRMKVYIYMKEKKNKQKDFLLHTYSTMLR